MKHYEAIIEALEILGGEATIKEIDDLINKKHPHMWKPAGTALADMVPKSYGGNVSSTIKEEFRVLERISPGRYRLK
jgi:hypothetical protein